jgi:hypothetical protein
MGRGGCRPAHLLGLPGIGTLVLRHVQQKGIAIKQLIQRHLTGLQKVTLGMLPIAVVVACWSSTAFAVKV